MPVGELASHITDAHKTFVANIVSGVLAAMQHTDLADQATGFLHALIAHGVRASIHSQLQPARLDTPDSLLVSVQRMSMKVVTCC